MRVDIEVRIGGKRNRTCVATIERDANTTIELGIGLQLAEVKLLMGRLQECCHRTDGRSDSSEPLVRPMRGAAAAKRVSVDCLQNSIWQTLP